MYYSCHCIKRNGLQHDCRRTGCGGEPACLVLPDPLCAPSQLARARGLADPAPFGAHTRTKGDSGAGGSKESGSGTGKRFIVCELKGISPDMSTDKGGECCKCPTTSYVPPQGPSGVNASNFCLCSSAKVPQHTYSKETDKKCPCDCNTSSGNKAMFVFDEKMIKEILSSFETKDLANKNDGMVLGPGLRKVAKPNVKEECTRPGCLHWKPPPPCVWDAPCKADCFEAHPGIQPGRNPLTGGGGNFVTGASKNVGASSSSQPRQVMKMLKPESCTGCCAPGGGSGVAAGGGGPASGLPVLVMKLC